MKPLYPLALLYEGLVRFRNRLYGAGMRPVVRLKHPVISIGNLTMGGTGKTPTVIELGRILQNSGLKISVLSRGYRGKHRGGPLLVSDGQQILTNARTAGDEALVIARNLPKALVVVARDRGEGGKWLENRFAVEVHLLDDGFQHLKLHRDLNLLLIDVSNPFAGGMPPLGHLREPLEAIRRADCVILTRTERGHHYDDLIHQLRQYQPEVPFFQASQEIVSGRDLGQTLSFPIENLNGKNMIAFAGIANPSQFFSLLRRSDLRLMDTLSFPDHHEYKKADLERIKTSCREKGVDVCITTEKDAEKLEPGEFEPLRVVSSKVVFEFNDLEAVRKLMLNRVGVLT